MDETIEALGQRFQGRHLVDEALHFVRKQTENGNMTQLKSQIKQSADTAVHTVVDTVKANPIPAALVGAGIAWYFYSQTRDDSSRNGYTYEDPIRGYYDEPYIGSAGGESDVGQFVDGGAAQAQGQGEGMLGDGSMGGVQGSTIPGSQEDLTVNVGDRVYFGYDRYDLTPEALQQLQLQSQWLAQYPNVGITVEGHADERGTREYNLALGDRRASSVRDYLVSLGVNGSRVKTISYGKERPEVTGSDPQSWAQNRRAITRVD